MERGIQRRGGAGTAAWLVLLALGLVLFHATFSFAGGFRRLLAERRGASLRAQMVMPGLAMLLFLPAIEAGSILGQPVRGFVFPARLGPLLGHRVAVVPHRATQRLGFLPENRSVAGPIHGPGHHASFPALLFNALRGVFVPPRLHAGVVGHSTERDLRQPVLRRLPRVAPAPSRWPN